MNVFYQTDRLILNILRVDALPGLWFSMSHATFHYYTMYPYNCQLFFQRIIFAVAL